MANGDEESVLGSPPERSDKGTTEEPSEDALFRYFLHIFGDDHPKLPVYLRDKRDGGDGVPFVLRLLDEGEIEKVEARVGAFKYQEQKGPAWVREPLAAALVSINGLDVPENLDKRRELVRGWHRAIVQRLFQGYQLLEGEELAAYQIALDPKDFPGEDSGLSSSSGEFGESESSPSNP